MYRYSLLEPAFTNFSQASPLVRIVPAYSAQESFVGHLQAGLDADDCACGYRKCEEDNSSQSNALDDVPLRAFVNPFSAVVRSIGGQPEKLLNEFGLDTRLLSQEDGKVKYRTMAELFEKASIELECPDFGLELTRHTDNWSSVLGPLTSVMQNASTLRHSFQCCQKYLHIYSTAVHISMEKDDDSGREYLLWDLLVNGIAFPRQVAEYALGLTYRQIKYLSNGTAQLAEVWFSHSPLAPLKKYREYFGVPVHFGKPYNAIYFGRSDLDMPIATRSEKIFDTSLGWVDRQYHSVHPSLARRVRVILSGLLALGRCSQTTVAQVLKVHPRTLQRRLCDEGTTFEMILNSVRREIALRNLADHRVPLVDVVEKLGYSEASVLTRSCYRWFNKSPRQLRKVEVQAYQTV